jgi:hypothetical protein
LNLTLHVWIINMWSWHWSTLSTSSICYAKWLEKKKYFAAWSFLWLHCNFIDTMRCSSICQGFLKAFNVVPLPKTNYIALTCLENKQSVLVKKIVAIFMTWWCSGGHSAPTFSPSYFRKTMRTNWNITFSWRLDPKFSLMLFFELDSIFQFCLF